MTKSLTARFKSRNAALVAIILLVFAAYLPTLFVKADADPALVGGSNVTGYSGTPAPITDLQLAGTGNPTVPVKLMISGGTLAMATTTGLTFTGPSSGSTLQFSGTLSDVNAALATLTYTRNGVGSYTLEASLVNPGEVFFPGNNHLYEYVSYNSTWVNANANAGTRTKYGATGYLTTITSQAENDFVAARLLNAGWMGASDAGSEGDWKWVTGPENGTSFWSGNFNGGSVSGRYANWGTGEPNDSSNEDCAQFLTGGTGKWNDLNCSSQSLPGYVVEYGSSGSPIEISAKNVSITINAANQYPVTSSLSPTSYVNGSWGNDTTPTLNFNATDPDSGNTVAYQVQIDDTSNFSSPVVSYTSALVSQGLKSFTVGQNAGTGTYAVGSSGQTLSDGQYYWRVRATDNIGAVGSYTTAASGGIAFGIDTEAPSQPPTPSTSSLGNDNTPTFTWDPITSTGSTSGTVTIQWSQDPDFGLGTISSGSVAWPANTSYTPSTPLSDGVWYFRTYASDSAGNYSPHSSSTTITIDTTAPTVPGKPSVGKVATNDTTPTWKWSASTDSSAGLHTTEPYTVEWSENEDFSSVTATSVATTNGFTIPDLDELAEGEWYFRVRAKDNLGNTSGYSQVGQVLIDTTAPSVPSKPVLTSSKNDTPTWTWEASTDDGAGMNDVPYIVEWSQNSSFGGTVYSNSSVSTSYQHTSKLSSGTWYFRVKAQDAVDNVSVYSQSSSVTFMAPVVKTTSNNKPQASNEPVGIVNEPAQGIAAPTPIILNLFKEYTGGKGKGKTLNLEQFQVIYFTHNGQEHTVTVKQITADYVIVTIASTPTDVKVVRGTTVPHDVDGDGKNDISLSFAAIVGNKAQMSFKQLSSKTATGADTVSFNIWPYILAGTLVMIVGYVARQRFTASK